MPIESLPAFIRDHYEVREWRHATAILSQDFPHEFADVIEVLEGFRLRRSHIVVGGKNKSLVSASIDQALEAKGWQETQFKTQIKVDEQTSDSPTHKVDCFKNKVALEIEWNNKDPFFDRDLNNFRLLFDLRVISVGNIITRADHLQDIFAGLGRGPSYGNSTTVKMAI